ncbi:hypothetical protein PVAND_011690 [Polypedilum vanderplanki]|uniref:Uncharacterized protein n=1 Tax=Polypedilum vanderplanki TaxID=319348 RepID=A0A9J6CKY8_POLVA|nr:hypothetical protein PVAND_011690 [Polypedilum vanderplanki]
MFKNISKQILNDVRQEHTVKALALKKRPHKEIFNEWLKEKVESFCSVTSLHGYIHTIQKDYHPFERHLWLALSFFALIAAIILLWISWNWNAETPTTTVIESTNYPTYNLPFPAVTICNMNKISRQAALEAAKSMQRSDNRSNLSDDELINKFKLMLHFMGSGNANTSSKEYEELHDILEINNKNINYFLETLTPKCTDILERCSWKGSLWRCDSIFQPINTSEGVCCSFNNYAFPKQNYDLKILSSIPKTSRRVTSCGFQTGLSVLLKPFTDDYVGTEIASSGFKIMIHNSYDNADSNSVTKLIPAKSEAYLTISPESTYSTTDVFDLTPDSRNCLQPNERKMDTFSQYSYINCVAECRSALVNEICGCVPYTLPNNGTMKKCKIIPHLKCIQTNYLRFAGSTFQLNNDSTETSKYLRQKCKCLPDCLFHAYPSEVSTGTLFRQYSRNSISFFKDITLTNQTLVHVFFNDLISTHYRKDMYQNWLGILAAFGGLLGLFLGFSLVTGFELIYFFTIRALFDKLANKMVKADKHVH